MQNRQLPRPASAPLPLEDLQGMAEEIQSALSFASRLCFDDEGEEEDKFVAREDVRLLYAKLGCISSNWQQLMRASDLHQQQSRAHSFDEAERASQDGAVGTSPKPKKHHVVTYMYHPERQDSTEDNRLDLQSRGAKTPILNKKYSPDASGEGISLGSILYPQYKTSNVISRVISGVISYLHTEPAAQLRTGGAGSCDESEFSIGSAPQKASGTRRVESLSVGGTGNPSTRSSAASPTSRSRTISPTGRRMGKKAKQPNAGSSSKERILYARKMGQKFSSGDQDENEMTIFSVTGIDKGTNTDAVLGIKMADIEKGAAALEAESSLDADNSIISQISFPESIPPKSKYVLDSTLAYFPELGVPSSPYAKKKNHAPDSRIVQALKTSSNPLVTLYNEYWQYIPSVFRARLLSTSATRNEFISSRDSLNLLFDGVLAEIEKIELTLNICSKGIEHSTKLTQSLIIAGENKKLSASFQKALTQLLINVAEIEVSAVWADIQLIEYRDIFHKFFHMGMPNLTQMVKACTPYRLSQQKFVGCENISVRMCSSEKKYQQTSSCLYMSLQRNLLDRIIHLKSRWASTLRVAPEKLFVSEADIQIRLSEYIDTINELQSERMSLAIQLRTSQTQLESAARELLETQLQIDRTPNALLFYVTLLDPAILPSLHTIIDEMKQFKKFVSGELHFEFTSVRRGLEACTTVLPYVERFLLRFGDLKKKWIKDRVGKFTVMGLAGGDADATAVCPLCAADTRMLDRK